MTASHPITSGHRKPDDRARARADADGVALRLQQNAFAQRGAAPGTMSQPQFAAFVDAEITKWSNVIRTANVSIE